MTTEGARRVCVAVLKVAVNDFVKNPGSSRAHRDAWDYFFKGEGNFEQIAQWLGLNAESVRKSLLERRKEAR